MDFVGPQTTVLGLLPFFGVFGLNAVLGGWLRSGARLVIMDGFDGFFEWSTARRSPTCRPRRRCSTGSGSDDRSATHLTSLTTVVCGGAALPEDLREEFAAQTRVRVDLGYGLTEAAPGVSTTVGGRVLGHGHVGRPLPGVEVRIGRGEDGDEPGEIAVRGANLFSGYWPDGSGGPDPDGWFGTGDIGYLRDGELFLVDRAQELISVNGFPVYPAEVEEAILELPGVESVAVLGRADPRTGSQVVAFVTGQELTEEAVAAHCAGRLAKFKRPTTIAVVDALPRGTTGQVQKGRLRGTLAAEEARRDAAGAGPHPAGLPPVRPGDRAGGRGLRRDRGGVRDPRRRRGSGAPPAVHRPGAGDLRRRRPARLLAGRPGAAAGGADPAASAVDREGDDPPGPHQI